MYPVFPVLPTTSSTEKTTLVFTTSTTAPENFTLGEEEVIILACVGSALGLLMVIALVCYCNKPEKSDEESQRRILAARQRSNTLPSVSAEVGVDNPTVTGRKRTVSFQSDVGGSNLHVTHVTFEHSFHGLEGRHSGQGNQCVDAASNRRSTTESPEAGMSQYIAEEYVDSTDL